MCAAQTSLERENWMQPAAVRHVLQFCVLSTSANPTAGSSIASRSVTTITQDEPYAQLAAHTLVIAAASVGGEESSVKQSCGTCEKAKKNLLGKTR